MAAFDAESIQDGLVFDLGGTHQLESVLIWNYNKPAYTDMGVARANVSIWTESAGWKTICREAAFLEAEGTDDYDEPTHLSFEPVTAQKVRLDNLVCINPDSKQLGLSKVRFFEPLGPAACNSSPADKAKTPFTGSLPLRWTAGKNALVHAVYLGDTPDSLTLQGKITGPAKVNVEGLQPDKTYYWCIEEIQQDGTCTKGPAWSFKTGRVEVAWWPLDENANDAAGGALNGTMQGSPQWVEGHSGKALLLDGQTSVQVPPLHISSNAMTVCGWMRAEDNEPFTGIVFCRSNKTATGLNISPERTLGYHWRDKSDTYGWNSQLAIPLNQWVFAAITIEPSQAALYLWDGKEMKTVVNQARHEIEKFDMPIFLGQDPASNDRFFKGSLDEVQLFDYALTQEQITSLCQGQKVAWAAGSIRLANASFVNEDQSLQEIAKQSSRQQAAGGKSRKLNLLAVAIIGAAVLGMVFVSTCRKKK
ncbi:MAG: LamG domain-containing protein [Planctomycetaceae bacterium]|nr:LamG domain-containing protein [Planctomycetaceae bacterium]